MNVKQFPIAKLIDAQTKNNSLLCVGLDSDFTKIPESFKKLENPQYEFNKWIIDQTRSHVCAYKINTSFYEARGSIGWRELELTCRYLKEKNSQIFTIADAKRADIGNTNQGYVEAIFDHLDFDAITLHPYLGREALQPFLERKDKISIILCKTSNLGAGELQDLELVGKKQRIANEQIKLWQLVAEEVSNHWNSNENCMLVVGATYPKDLAGVRKIVGEMTFLVPGIGAQGGDIVSVVRNGLNQSKKGMIINSSRGIIFTKNPGDKAQQLKEAINKICYGN